MQIRFSTAVGPRAVWLLCYLVAAPYATVCTPRLRPMLGSPTLCLTGTAALMIASVAGPVLMHRWLELRDRRAFVRAFHGQNRQPLRANLATG
jgi:hypothetical protein